MADEQDKKRASFTGTQVLVVRCKACKKIIAAQSLAGAAEPLGQFLLDHRDADMALSRKRQTLGGGCVCQETPAEPALAESAAVPAPLPQ